MKLRLMAASVAALVLGGTAMAQTQQPAQAAPQQAAPVAIDRNALSYAIGYDLGRSLAESGEQVDVAQVVQAVQDGFAKKDPTVQPQQMAQQLEGMQRRMMERARAAFTKVATENKTKSDQFLASNRAKAGVKTTASGIQYKELEAGSGTKPTANSEVQVHLRGSLAASGQEFLSTYAQNQPITLKVSEAPLQGLREVLPMMSPGARWEVVLPPDQAYGAGPQSPVGPNQAVTMDIKLVSAK
ncbi:FKBP-type peptidyl-prolyl cis-trans isomerase N-terminal domain-containing protein [Coralloluteibacterium stylophorae]|uniref:Peptidyl-prolyl cis-trans isomerase n=3 Tax=Coralloluteibacterium stylophorae TaxID=1776034 RepID=A0AAP2G360_9GAMM|nr:FKBP-type peptidyl-prolyl cis-trans isomerase N-terminal domain-containing protein [Coralloluteibacterium stylophorae]MBS7458913.1 FKBP-type peptidyl-prolyl cis-trans isomerase [Coralloluteibacterium stylophorae]